MNGVLTWIVHGAALVALLALSLRLLPRLDAATRYGVWWAAMAAVLLLPTSHIAWSSAAAPLRVDATTDGASVAPPARADQPPAIILPLALAPVVPWAAAAAALLAIVRLLQLQRALTALRRVRGRCRPLPAEVEAQLTSWSAVRSRGRRAQLLVSDEIELPAVLGAGPPLIVVPAWAVATLEPETLDLLVLHEHAHVERGDDRDLVVQASIAAMFAWHPVVWWIGRRLDDERERACDDRVVALTGRATGYAQSLLGVVAQRRRLQQLWLAPGIGRPGRRFVQRVERLLNGPPPAPPRYRIVALSAVVAALLAGVAGSTIAGPRVMVFGGNWENWDRISPSPMVVSHPRASELAAPAVSLTSVSPATSVSGLVVGETKTSMPAPDRTVAGRPVPATAASSPSTSAEPEPEEAMRAEPARGETLTMAAAATAPASPAWHAAPASDRAVSANGGDVDRADTQWTLTTAAQTVPSAWLPAALTFELRAPAPPPKSVNPWKRTADAGESIGRTAAHAGVKTAGFFSRMGRAIASSF